MARVQEVVFQDTGPRVMAPGVMTPLPWPDWRARVRALEVDGVRADYVEMGPYDIEVPALEDRAELPVRMMLVVVLEGTSVGRIGGERLTLSPRQAALIGGRVAMSFHAPEPVRAVRLFVDEDHLPHQALLSPDRSFIRLKRTPLVTGCIGLISGLLQVGNPEVEPHDEVAVSTPMITLMSSLLDEALHEHGVAAGSAPAVASSGRAVRREAIETYIDDHLADRELAATTVAVALGVAVRTVHAAYEGSGSSVGAEIRSRRLAKAQVLLALRREPPNVGALAERVGLTRDRLTQLFRDGTGRTAAEWWRDHHDDDRSGRRIAGSVRDLETG